MPSHHIDELAALVVATVQGKPFEGAITGVAPLERAGPNQLSYLSQGKYRKYLAQTHASVVLVTAEDAALCNTTALVVANPEVAFAKIAALFKKVRPHPAGIHPTAIIGAGCTIDPSASIGPYCVIGDCVRIGARTVIQSATILQDDVVIGADGMLYPRVTVYSDVVIGDRVTLHSGVVIGADGFGLAQDKGQWIEIPQLGRVIIGNGVSIGVNTCIDRGALDDTVIEDGVKLDNLIQVAHNVRIGAYTVVAGTVGIAGSANIGRHCIIGGGACINGHITIADRVVITGMAMVIHSITEPGAYSSGTSILPNRQWHRSVHHFRDLDSLAKRIKQLEKITQENITHE